MTEDILDIFSSAIQKQKGKADDLEAKYKEIKTLAKTNKAESDKELAKLNTELKSLMATVTGSMPADGKDGRDGRDGRDFNVAEAKVVSKELVDDYVADTETMLSKLQEKLSKSIAEATATGVLDTIVSKHVDINKSKYTGPKGADGVSGKDGKNGKDGKSVSSSEVEEQVKSALLNMKDKKGEGKSRSVKDVQVQDGKLTIKYCKGKDKVLTLPKSEYLKGHQFSAGSPTRGSDVTKITVERWLNELGISSGGTPKADIVGTEDIEITDPTKGYILRSPDNTRWRITINNDGNLTTTEVI